MRRIGNINSQSLWPRRLQFWFTWFLNTTLGGLAGVIVAARVYTWQQEWSGTDSASLLLGGCLFFGGSGGIIWLFLGAAQSIVLYLFLPSFGFRSAFLWPVVSTIGGTAAVFAGAMITFVGGGIVALALTLVFGTPLPNFISLAYGIFVSVGAGGVGGFVIASCQLLLLRLHLNPNERRKWIIANVLGWAAGLLSAGLIHAIQGNSSAFAFDVAVPRETLESISYGTLVIAIANAITGAYLARTILAIPMQSIAVINERLATQD